MSAMYDSPSEGASLFADLFISFISPSFLYADSSGRTRPSLTPVPRGPRRDRLRYCSLTSE
ncbi:hypothetical protein COLSTE_00467 [Collinsella stercoris DSM 13279]|uniref:Uncharacterized protein n=1 Tax=Collinsella stercoris DSM 13279 TaxID=445975 RepID=B6G8S5_9ACTN|nr:hypothetical protein COLSTE_00467 [Collinsella stercoris DSM 13279]